MGDYPAVISDHALLRWLEREHGLNVEELRAELLAEAKPFLRVGAVTFRLGSVWGVAERGYLKTVVPEKPSSVAIGAHMTRVRR